MSCLPSPARAASLRAVLSFAAVLRMVATRFWWAKELSALSYFLRGIDRTAKTRAQPRWRCGHPWRANMFVDVLLSGLHPPSRKNQSASSRKNGAILSSMPIQELCMAEQYHRSKPDLRTGRG